MRSTGSARESPGDNYIVPAVRYRLLGPVVALVDGRVVELGGPRQRGVLVVLLTQAGSLVPASRIIDAVWGDEPPASAANLVQRSVSQLRKAVGHDAIEILGGELGERVCEAARHGAQIDVPQPPWEAPRLDVQSKGSLCTLPSPDLWAPLRSPSS